MGLDCCLGGLVGWGCLLASVFGGFMGVAISLGFPRSLLLVGVGFVADFMDVRSDGKPVGCGIGLFAIRGFGVLLDFGWLSVCFVALVLVRLGLGGLCGGFGVYYGCWACGFCELGWMSRVSGLCFLAGCDWIAFVGCVWVGLVYFVVSSWVVLICCRFGCDILWVWVCSCVGWYNITF